jgi:signal transduction histidine kinase
MNEKIGFLNFFYESGKFAEPVTTGDANKLSNGKAFLDFLDPTFLLEGEKLLDAGIWRLDLSNNSCLLSPGMIHLLGFPENATHSITRDGLLNFVDHGSRKQFEKLLADAAESGEPFEMEFVLHDAKGFSVNACVKGRGLKSDNGQVSHIIGALRDSTSTQRIQQNIIELNRSNQELEQFAYIASHDLQEPLRKISMYTERLKSKLGESVGNDAELFMKRIEASATNMRILIDNLLELSRASRSSHAYTDVSLKMILTEVLNELELKIEETNTLISIPESLPFLQAVSTELKQLFTNLVSNAIKFTKPMIAGEIIITCNKLSEEEVREFELHTGELYYRIDVADKGIGFEQQEAERIFQAFQRLHGRSEYPGSGIGLAICKKIVENHQGLIFATSTPGQGSTFTVILPEKQQ